MPSGGLFVETNFVSLFLCLPSVALGSRRKHAMASMVERLLGFRKYNGVLSCRGVSQKYKSVSTTTIDVHNYYTVIHPAVYVLQRSRNKF